MIKWAIILCAAFGLFCGLMLYFPKAREIATVIGGYHIAWWMIGVMVVIYLGAKLKS